MWPGALASYEASIQDTLQPWKCFFFLYRCCCICYCILFWASLIYYVAEAVIIHGVTEGTRSSETGFEPATRGNCFTHWFAWSHSVRIDSRFLAHISLISNLAILCVSRSYFILIISACNFRSSIYLCQESLLNKSYSVEQFVQLICHICSPLATTQGPGSNVTLTLSSPTNVDRVIIQVELKEWVSHWEEKERARIVINIFHSFTWIVSLNRRIKALVSSFEAMRWPNNKPVQSLGTRDCQPWMNNKPAQSLRLSDMNE